MPANTLECSVPGHPPPGLNPSSLRHGDAVYRGLFLVVECGGISLVILQRKREFKLASYRPAAQVSPIEWFSGALIGKFQLNSDRLKSAKKSSISGKSPCALGT